MIVSVDIRLASMISALSNVIAPAVETNAFATEQAQLVAGHLQALQAQREHSAEYERLEHRYLRHLAADVVLGTEGGPRTSEAAGRLGELLDSPEPVGLSDLRAAHAALATAVADFVAAEGEDGTDESVARSTRSIVRAEHAQSLRDRSFFKPFGYEDGSVDVEPIDQMMDGFRNKYPTRDGASA
ncbi:hypothetical protein INP57_26395 [Saccharopolyspora sp. HNM0986]|uniref:hypothetical protein n=1 Tax=Saccharopolyspora galaxeae TaxID=2781241 RepID=UPI00190A3CA8|nr:hypothetical protein [Saccharopolyspora sp. HNM0986]MBK0870344.1 hypothetical protein [Saccharopolyspora sp. HNM0986]